MRPVDRYGKTQKETASKERTLVLLFQTALRHMRAAATTLESEGRSPRAVVPLTKASDIVIELEATLDRAQAPELCDHLASVYQFVATRLTSAAMRGDPAMVREAERAFAPLVDAFEQAVAASAQPAP